MDIINLLVTLVSGAVGGNIAGAAMPEKSLGTVGNSIAGFVGGGIGHYLLQTFGVIAATHMGSGFDAGALLANIGVSGVSGALLTAIVAWVKSACAK